MTQTPNQDARGIDERLSDYRELLSQFEAVRARLRRAEEERETVPRRVYEKVRAEYDHQLDALRARMTPLRDELEGLRHHYDGQLKEADSALEAVEEELAELAFRHRIGEHSDESAAAQRNEIEARLQAARARIDAVRTTLAAMDHAAPHARPAGEPATVPAPQAPVPQAPVAEVETPEVSGGAVEPAVPSRRPVLRTSSLGETARSGFENPHDWIDEFGNDLKRSEAEPVSRPRPVPAPAVKDAPERPVTPPGAPPSLVFVSGPHAGQSIPLLLTTLTIGREHDNNIEIKDVDVARYHARILNDRGEYVVEDMASTTGTWVNGERVQRAALGHGDVIRIGQTEIAVDFEWASNSLERAGIDPAA
ncbi:MAG TPA: FHA domain-containing protein [Candidatus Krumholzibacteria bacterium]|nr:FHA domain-containing protein [Candidatus Krumholzibacteria bacterium]